ncbi:MAG: serine/threonine-protein phosphatase [Leptospiraceae bacterium]|nr:serine/threonine-protein phosphatase [Leptospiraceae bacterium]
MMLKQLYNYGAYPLFALLLLFAFWFPTPDSGYRLPFYYTPDGAILPVQRGLLLESATVRQINGHSPLQSPGAFTQPGFAVVITDTGSFHLRLEANQPWRLLLDFKLVILFALVNLLAALWLIVMARDFLLGIMCLIQTGFAWLAYLVVVNPSPMLLLLWLGSSIFMPQALLNVGFRTTGKDIPAIVLVTEVILGLFLLLVSFVGLDNFATVRKLGYLNYSLFALALLITLALQVQNALEFSPDRIEKFKNRVLLLGTFLGVLVPSSLFGLSYVWAWRSLSIDWIVLPGIVFPLTLIYSTYRLHFVKFQLILTRSLMAGILTVGLIGSYGTVLLIHSLLLPEQGGEYSWIVNVVFILILVFLLDPVRRSISSFLEKRIYRLDERLTESLKVLTTLIARHSRIQPTVNSFLQEIQKTLEVEKLSFLISGDTFAELNMRSGQLQRMPTESPVWRYLRPGQMRVTAYLAYAAGYRGELFQYMYKNNYLIALGVIDDEGGKFTAQRASGMTKQALSAIRSATRQYRSPATLRAALLVGYKQERQKLRLNEIRYLQEAAKLSELLIYNYALLIREMEKRQRIRELNLAGILQRSLPGPLGTHSNHFNLAWFNKAAVSVSGDYLEILELSPERYAFILGDVSGHGLGTGYIVSAIRSIIRTHLLAGQSLVHTVNSVNAFLVDRYRGGEFITLFASILEIESGRLEYINAAHPAPIVLRQGSPLQSLLSTQRLIGVLPTIYYSEEITLLANDKLVLYSDGVTETFDADDRAYGEERLEQLLEQNSRLEVAELVSLIEKRLLEFRGQTQQSDDTTLVAIQFTPQIGLFQNLLDLFGIGKHA